MTTPHEKLRIAVARVVDKTWVKKLLKWIEDNQEANETDIKNELKLWVEEYVPHHFGNGETHTEVSIERVTIH